MSSSTEEELESSSHQDEVDDLLSEIDLLKSSNEGSEKNKDLTLS
jgi:hypothetical protein